MKVTNEPEIGKAEQIINDSDDTGRKQRVHGEAFVSIVTGKWKTK